MFRPHFQITPAISKALMQIEACRQAIDHTPVTAATLAHLRETALLAATHYSTRIEGNRLTLPEVKAALAGARFPDRERDETEVRNHFRAHEWMEARAAKPAPVREGDIRRIHGLVMTGGNRASPWRTQQNIIRDAMSGRIVYLPPEPKDVAGLTRDLVAWINDACDSGELPVPIIAALAHYQLATIHPWLDGNGRTARLLATLILRQSGYGLQGIYSLDEHYAMNLGAYHDALTIGAHNYYEGRVEADVTPFIAFFCDGMAQAFTKVRAAARALEMPRIQDTAATLRDLDPRQRRLLELFQKNGSATATEMAEHIGMSPRTLVALCREWIASGFLEYQNAARKNRSYKIGERFQGLMR